MRHDGTFFLVSHKVFDGAAYHSLSPTARAAYYEFLRLYNGSNNGNLLMSSRMMAGRLGCRKTAAAAAIVELLKARFIENYD